MSENLLNITDDMFEPLDESEKNSEFIAVAIKTFAKDAWDRFRRNPLALGGLIFLIILLLIIAALVVGYFVFNIDYVEYIKQIIAHFKK